MVYPGELSKRKYANETHFEAFLRAGEVFAN